MPNSNKVINNLFHENIRLILSDPLKLYGKWKIKIFNK